MAGVTIKTGDTLSLDFVNTTLVITNGNEVISCDLKGERGYDGIRGVQGIPGIGIQGAQGEKPVKGFDYWTDADKEEIVQDVLIHFPEAEGGEF